jgi:hypothetical protein
MLEISCRISGTEYRRSSASTKLRPLLLFVPLRGTSSAATMPRCVATDKRHQRGGFASAFFNSSRTFNPEFVLSQSNDSFHATFAM